MAAPPALAQDPFSDEDARSVFEDSAAASETLDESDCPEEIRLPDGSCPPQADERGFSFARTPPASAPAGNTTSRRAPAAAPASTTRRQPALAAPSPAQSRPAAGAARELPIRFQLGSYDLSDQSKRNIEALARVMMEPANASKRIMVAGHTDRSGSADINYQLSRQRAQAVADYMATLGVPPERIETRGYGFDNLLPGVAPTNSRNRRVEVQRVD